MRYAPIVAGGLGGGQPPSRSRRPRFGYWYAPVVNIKVWKNPGLKNDHKTVCNAILKKLDVFSCLKLKLSLKMALKPSEKLY